MSSAPDDPLAMFTSASWQCPVCDRPGDLHDERCLVLEIAQIARRRKDGNRRLVQTNGRLRELASHESDEIVHWREQFEAMSFERDAAEAEVRRLTEGLRFYADPSTYEESSEPDPKRFATGIIPIRDDEGGRAREALAGPGGRDAV